MSIFRTHRHSWNLAAYVGHTGLSRLDSGCWTLDTGLWTLESGPWTLDTVADWFRAESVSDSDWLNYWNFFEWDSLRISWSRFFFREYRFWRGYFEKFSININSYVIKEYWKKFLLWEIELQADYSELAVQSHPFRNISPENTVGRVLLLVKLQTDYSE